MSLCVRVTVRGGVSVCVGVEVGQIIIVLLFLLMTYFISKIFFSKKGEWILFVSSLILGISLTLIINAKFW